MKSNETHLEVHPLTLDGQQHLHDFADERQRAFPSVDVLLERLDETRRLHRQQLHLVVLERLRDLLRLPATTITPHACHERYKNPNQA